MRTITRTPTTITRNNPTITQQQNVNRNLRVTNPEPAGAAIRIRRPNNPKLRHGNPNLQTNNPNLQGTKQNLVLQKGTFPQGALKLGPGKPNFSPVGLKPGPGGFQQIKPAFPAVAFKNKFFPIHKGPHSHMVRGIC